MDLTDLIRKKSVLFILLIFMVLGCSHSGDKDSRRTGFPFSSEGRVDPQVFDYLRMEWIPSTYFDRAMHYEGSQFRAVGLTEFVRRFHPEDNWNALLLIVMTIIRVLFPSTIFSSTIFGWRWK